MIIISSFFSTSGLNHDFLYAANHINPTCNRNILCSGGTFLNNVIKSVFTFKPGRLRK